MAEIHWWLTRYGDDEWALATTLERKGMSSLKTFEGKPIWVSRDPGTMMVCLWNSEPIYREEYRRFCPSAEQSYLCSRHVTTFMERTGLNVEPCHSMRIILSATVLKEVDWSNTKG